jgi:hypothetical protein
MAQNVVGECLLKLGGSLFESLYLSLAECVESG